MSTPHASEVPFRSLTHGDAATGTGGGLFFYRSQENWAAQWRRLHHRRRPEPPLPQVDWATDMVALLVCGTRPTGGHHVAIESVAFDGTSIEVRGVERRPGPDAVTTQALTNPFHAVAFAAHDGAERLMLRIEYGN
jgi:hypothetical protein